ncbi:MAG TPA: alpha/beta fold hydrolase [Allosphingosinicella sp.]|nr:alpha/beta fold hydrolase [Allosphingosinicella sp.]
MSVQPPEDRAPPLHLLLWEGAALAARIYCGFGRLGERGSADGQPLMVIPGFFASDRSTLALQRAFAEEGYRVCGWGMGLNLGARADTIERVVERLERFAGGRPATLVGWSLGGIYAREAAKVRPDLVARVVTLGAPFSGDRHANNAWRLYELVNSHTVDRPPIESDLSAKPPVPTIAFWSRRDGMVAPGCARGTDCQSDRQIEIDCSHMGFATSLRAIRQVVAALRD